MASDFIPGIDFLSTLFTVGYILWLATYEWRHAPSSRAVVVKRSLMNQHVSNRVAVA